jgi:flagellar hook-associated protein 1
MSGLFASLNSSVHAMNAHSRAVEIAGKNLANVNNSSYARQRVVYGDRGTVITPDGAESLGLEALGVEQIRDTLLDRQVMREGSLSSYYTAKQSAYQRAQAGLGESISSTSSTNSANTSSDTGIGAALDDFFNAFQALAANPTDTGQRSTVIQASSILADRMQLADTRLTQVQSDLDAQVDSGLSSANTLLSSIADLNSQIARFEVNNPGSAVDLRDSRQAALEELAALVPITVTDTDTTGGQLQISAKAADGSDVLLVDDATVASTFAFDGTDITAGSPATTLDLASGSVQGSLDARDEAVQSLRDNLDALARQLVTSVNGAYGSDFFDASGTTAGTFALNSAITSTSLTAGTGSAGDNSIAAAISDLASTKFSTAASDEIDGTFTAFFATTVSDFGQALSGANARLTDQENIETLVRSQRDAVSGVSLDEEMADLMKYQRAFQASSRVFQTIDDLLDTVISQMGT